MNYELISKRNLYLFTSPDANFTYFNSNFGFSFGPNSQYVSDNDYIKSANNYYRSTWGRLNAIFNTPADYNGYSILT